MSDRYGALVQRLRERVLRGPGVTPAALRDAVHASSAGAMQSVDGHAELPADLRGVVDKVARRAYEVTDGDIESLRRAGYSEDAIFEILVSAALGAGTVRLGQGLAALERGRDAT